MDILNNKLDNSSNIILKNYNLYLLTHTIHNKTYLGITNNLTRRIRQHNKEIKGGAKYTSINLQNGKWKYHLYVTQLTKSQALSYERIIKNKRRKAKGKTPLERRIFLINQVIDKNENIIYINK